MITTSHLRHRAAQLLIIVLAPAAAIAHQNPLTNPNAPNAATVAPVLSADLRGEWVVHEGVTAIQFNVGLLKDLGLKLTGLETTGHVPHPDFLAFALAQPARIAFDTPGGGLEGLASAQLPHRGGVVFTHDGGDISMHDFVLRASGPGQLELVGERGDTLFTLTNAHTYRDAKTGKFVVLEMDLNLGRALAERIDKPEFAELVVGLVNITARVSGLGPDAAFDTREGQCIVDFGDGVVDVALLGINHISEIAREPGGRVALAPSAHLGNVGENDVRWYWSISPLGGNGPNLGSHPFLVMSYYRLVDGVIEQIGRSGLKHAWNTVNSACPCPGGQILFVGCEDTYGVSANGNQFYFGPRDELTAHTGQWTSLGSHFDALPVDDYRDHGNSPAHPPFEHRLVVAEADLTTPGAQYLVEAWYIVENDRDIFNGIAHRFVTQNLIGNVWDFEFADSDTTAGPAINSWVDPDLPGPLASNESLDTGVGHLQLATRVTDLGSGQYRYDYAVMNHDFDRQIGAFAIPKLPTATITEATFGDVDDDAGNDWQVTISGNAIEFSSSGGNGLDWGTLYNFGFVADVAPATTGTLMQAIEAGDSDYVALTALGPVDDATGIDSDGDSVPDSGDNCSLVANADQRDTDGDRYGNACDADFNGDLTINFADLAIMQTAFFTNGDLDTDLNGDRAVNFADLLIVKTLFFGPPGPSDIAP